MAETKICPLCGEEIMASAKKCRYCGEWLTEQTPVVVENNEGVEYAEAYPEALPIEVATPMEGNVPQVNPANPVAQVPNVSPATIVMPGAEPGQTVMSVGGQPIVLNIQQTQAVQQTAEQKVEQTVVVSGGSSSSAPDWIFGEMWVVAAGIGLATKSWWWFFISGIVGSVLLMVPFIGAVMCVVLGAAWGVLAGLLGAAFFSTSAGWPIGIFVGLGAIYAHLEARKQNMDED